MEKETPSMRTLTTLVALMALAVAPGCVFPEWGYDVGDDYGASGSALATSDGVLEGEAGDVNVDRPREARVHEAYAYDSYAYVELRTRGDNGVIMQGYHIDGFDELQAGDELVFNESERYGYYDGSSNLHISTTGCAGPRDDTWDFDQGADEVVVQVEDGPEPGTLRLNITSRFDSYYGEGPQTVQGAVTVGVY